MFSVQIVCNFLQAVIFLVSVHWTMFSKATPSQTEIQQVAPPSTKRTRLSLKPPPEPLVRVHPHLHLFILIPQIQCTLTRTPTIETPELFSKKPVNFYKSSIDYRDPRSSAFLYQVIHRESMGSTEMLFPLFWLLFLLCQCLRRAHKYYFMKI